MGQKLSDLTSQRVIVLILTMLIMIPGFNWNSGLYGNYNNISDGGLKMMHDIYLADGNTTGFQQVSTQAACPAILDASWPKCTHVATACNMRLAILTAHNRHLAPGPQLYTVTGQQVALA